MKNIRLLISTDIKNNFSARSVAIIWYGTSILLIAAMVILFGVLLIGPELDKVSPDMDKLDIYFAVVLFSASLIGLGVNLNALGFTSMIKEKSRGNIQSLLVTTLKLKDIWIGKSLAVFIPGLIVGELMTFVTLLVVNYIYFVPTVGFFFNPWTAAVCFIAFPMIYFFLGLLVYLIGLTGKPVNANIIAQVFLPLFVNLVIQLTLRTSFMDFTSWPFFLANIIFSLIIAAIVMILQSRISREKVVLSY